MEFAFTAITTNDWKNVIAVAHVDQPGYTRLETLPTFDTYDQAQAHADRLNEDIGLTKLSAWHIVASTMR